MTKKDKKLAKEEEKPVLQSYSVKVEAMAPITLNYRIYAYSPEEALSKIEQAPLTNLAGQPKIFYGKLKKLKGEVFKFGTILKIFTKKY